MLQLLLLEETHRTIGIEDLNQERLLDIRLGQNKIYEILKSKKHLNIKITKNMCINLMTHENFVYKDTLLKIGKRYWDILVFHLIVQSVTYVTFECFVNIVDPQKECNTH